MTTSIEKPGGIVPARIDGNRAQRKEAHRQVSLFTGFGHLALFVWALLVTLPILWVFIASFKNTSEIFDVPWSRPHELRFENWSRAWNHAHVGTYFLNSVFVVGVSTFGTMLFGSMAAYVLSRYEFFGRRFIFSAFVAGLAFPTFLALVPLFKAMSYMRVPVLFPDGMLNTYTGLILVYIAYSLPFTIFFLSAFFRTLPSAVAEAGIIDGCSHTRLFFSVMLPMAKSGLISLTIFNIIGQWAQYLLPLVIMQDKSKYVLTQGIADISVQAGYEADWSGLFAALSMSILPMIIVYGIFQRQITSGLTAGAVK